MKKVILYFFQSFIIYFFFLLSKILGLNLSRILFSKIFINFGSLFRSKKVILRNLEKINPRFNDKEKQEIEKKMWANYGKTFIEYVHLKKFRESKNHISIKNKNIIRHGKRIYRLLW